MTSRGRGKDGGVSNKTKWILGGAGLIGIVLLACLLVALLAVGLGLFDGADRRGPVMHRDWMDDHCPECDGLSWANMPLVLLLLAIPLGIVVLIVVALVWLARAGRTRQGPPPEEGQTGVE